MILNPYPHAMAAPAAVLTKDAVWDFSEAMREANELCDLEWFQSHFHTSVVISFAIENSHAVTIPEQQYLIWYQGECKTYSFEPTFDQTNAIAKIDKDQAIVTAKFLRGDMTAFVSVRRFLGVELALIEWIEDTLILSRDRDGVVKIQAWQRIAHVKRNTAKKPVQPEATSGERTLADELREGSFKPSEE
jgi:hypothetical protein